MSSSTVFRTALAAVLTVGVVPCACAQSAAPIEPKRGGPDRVLPEPLVPRPPDAQVEEAPEITLDLLFDRLKKAKRPEIAQRVSREIEARWLSSGSDTIDLLMARVLAAMKANEVPLALDLLDNIVMLKPDYAEAWNKRATIYYGKKDIGRSIADIEMTLKLEPRHYGALYGLATMMKDLGDKKRALAAYRRALELNPALPNLEKTVKELTIEVEGRDL